MSSKIARIFLSPEAEIDIVEIYIAGIRSFGPRQADRYELLLRRAIEQDIAEFPGIGLARPELGKEVRSVFRGAHHIYYSVKGADLMIVRILHARMNVQADRLRASLKALDDMSSKKKP